MFSENNRVRSQALQEDLQEGIQLFIAGERDALDSDFSSEASESWFGDANAASFDFGMSLRTVTSLSSSGHDFLWLMSVVAVSPTRDLNT